MIATVITYAGAATLAAAAIVLFALPIGSVVLFFAGPGRD